MVGCVTWYASVGAFFQIEHLISNFPSRTEVAGVPLGTRELLFKIFHRLRQGEVPLGHCDCGVLAFALVGIVGGP